MEGDFEKDLDSCLDSLGEIRELVESNRFPSADTYVRKFTSEGLSEIKNLLKTEYKEPNTGASEVHKKIISTNRITIK